MKDNIHIGTQCINIPELQDKHSQLAPINPLECNYEDVQVIIGQEYYLVFRPIDLLLGEDSKLQCSVRLLIRGVISGPLSPSAGLSSSCFKCVDEDSSLANQMMSCCELESS